MLCSILLVNYSGYFSWQNTGNGHGCFPLVNIVNKLLHSYMEEVHGRLEFLYLYVQFIFHFVLLALNCVCLDAL